MLPEGWVDSRSRHLRTGRYSQSGQVYLVTFTTSNRNRYFLDIGLARASTRALVDGRLWIRSRLLAWVLMPDHWHGLVELGDGGTLSRMVRRLKANTSRATRRAGLQDPRVWARGFHDRAPRREEDMVDVARCVILNPVRAGLARRVRDYPFRDAIWVKRGCGQVDGLANGLRD